MYATLPSNSSPDYYPENKISDYIVHLPEELQLPGSWEVGLAEIQFNHSWYNVDTTSYWVIYQRGEIHIKSKLPSGYYQEPKQLIRLLLNQMKHDFQAKNEELIENGTLTNPIDFLLDLRYNENSQLAQLNIRNNSSAPTRVDNDGVARPSVLVHLAPFLTEMLGFAESTFHNVGIFHSERVVDMNPINNIYVYCDVIENRIVGHTLAPLLGVIASQGNPGSVISKRYDKLQYQPVMKKSFSEIQINLRDDQGNSIWFRKGRVIVTLHFRRKKLSQL